MACAQTSSAIVFEARSGGGEVFRKARDATCRNERTSITCVTRFSTMPGIGGADRDTWSQTLTGHCQKTRVTSGLRRKGVWRGMCAGCAGMAADGKVIHSRRSSRLQAAARQCRRVICNGSLLGSRDLYHRYRRHIPGYGGSEEEEGSEMQCGSREVMRATVSFRRRRANALATSSRCNYMDSRRELTRREFYSAMGATIVLPPPTRRRRRRGRRRRRIVACCDSRSAPSRPGTTFRRWRIGAQQCEIQSHVAVSFASGVPRGIRRMSDSVAGVRRARGAAHTELQSVAGRYPDAGDAGAVHIASGSRSKDGLLGDSPSRHGSSSLSESKNLFLSSLSPEFSAAIDGFLDLLEGAGVRPGYSFEFVRNAHECLESLMTDAREMLFEDSDEDAAAAAAAEGRTKGPPRGSSELSIPDEDGRGRRAAEEEGRFPRVRPEVFKATVSYCAEKRGLPKIVGYLEGLHVKAADVAKMVIQTESVDVVKARVTLLRQWGLRLSDMAIVLTTCPILLSRSSEDLEGVLKCLEEEVGIGKTRLVKVVRHSSEILGISVECIRTKISQLKALGLMDSHVAMIVRRNPRVLMSEIEDVFAPVMSYMTKLKVPKDKLGTLLTRNPAFLESSEEIDKHMVPLMEYLRSEGAADEDVGKIISGFPNLINYDLDADFKPTAELLEGLGVSTQSMGQILRKHPTLMTQRNNLLPKVEFFEGLGLTSAQVAELAEKAPQLLCLSVEHNLRPTVKYLETVGIEGASLRKILSTRPMVLAFSLEKLQRNVSFLLGEIGVSSNKLSSMIVRYPGVLSLSVEKKMRPTVEYLLSVGFKRSDIATIVAKAPSTLGFNLASTLAPKFEYAINEIGASHDDIVSFPAYFSYSLEKRIRSRFQLAKKFGLTYRLSSLYGVAGPRFIGGLTGEEDQEVLDSKLKRRRNRVKNVKTSSASESIVSIKRKRGRPQRTAQVSITDDAGADGEGGF